MKDDLSKKDFKILRDSLWNVLIVVVYLFILLNRAMLKDYFPYPIDFFLNTLPNFSAGFVGTFAFFKYLKQYKYGLFFAVFISGSWLTLEEYFPIFSHNLYFDYCDIFMSWAGCGLATFFIKTQKKYFGKIIFN